MAIRTDFAAGEVLAAADLNDTFGSKANLASPTFTGTPAAPTAAAGTNTTQIATTAFVQSSGGLVLTGSATFSASSSVSVNNCFSASYDNYRIIYDTTSNSSGSLLYFRLRVSGTDNSASVYSSMVYQIYTAGAGAGVHIASSGNTQFTLLISTSTAINTGSFDVKNPFIAEYTSLLGQVDFNSSSVGDSQLTEAHRHNSATSFTGFTLYPNTGTISGKVAVYGYKKP